MKYIISLLGVVFVICAVLFCEKTTQTEYVRIHITSNSNSIEDENLKYQVKDAVQLYLKDCLKNVKNCDRANEIILHEKENIEKIVYKIQVENGVDYSFDVSIKSEKIPPRVYDEIALQSGEYKTLSITLGDGLGENWWCVVFPTVCTVDENFSQNVEYISKLWEIINSVIKE